MPGIGILSAESTEAATESAAAASTASAESTATTTAESATSASTESAATATAAAKSATAAGATAESAAAGTATSIGTTTTGSAWAWREVAGLHYGGQVAGDIAIAKAIALHVANTVLQIILAEGGQPVDLALHSGHRDGFIRRCR
jgi:ABC-type amino acid transport substrate-binding protein